jgi:hypothetical protein
VEVVGEGGLVFVDELAVMKPDPESRVLLASDDHLRCCRHIEIVAVHGRKELGSSRFQSRRNGWLSMPCRARPGSFTSAPSHQFPLGMAMSLRRRMALLAWAACQGAAIIEDDYDSEFRFAGHPIEPLHSLDRDGRVIYVGSFSKTLLPTLRLGFLLTAPSLLRALRAAKYLSDWHTSLPPQAALARFIDEGKFARHVRRMRMT